MKLIRPASPMRPAILVAALAALVLAAAINAQQAGQQQGTGSLPPTPQPLGESTAAPTEQGPRGSEPAAGERSGLTSLLNKIGVANKPAPKIENGNSSQAEQGANNVGGGLFGKVKEIFRAKQQGNSGGASLEPQGAGHQQANNDTSSSHNGNTTATLKGTSTGNGALVGLPSNLGGPSGENSLSSVSSSPEGLSTGGLTGTQMKGSEDSPIDRVGVAIKKSADTIHDAVHKVEDKAAKGKSVLQALGRGVQLSGSKQSKMPGDSAPATTERQPQGNGRSRSGELPTPADTKKDNNASNNTTTKNANDEESLVVGVLDKAHELALEPFEAALKPIDKALGFDKDPLLKADENVYELLRAPLGELAKPVDNMVKGAFETVEESEKEREQSLLLKSEQERQAAKVEQEIERKEGRSVAGNIADKALDLAIKPLEIALKPLDRYMNKKQNPLIEKVYSIYGLSKKPFDSVAKPLETMLLEMGSSSNPDDDLVKLDPSKNPLYVTRLADGALNIADRVITAPLEFVWEPMTQALGLGEQGKKNSITEATHSLKNASRKGIELLTRPIDKIITEIADLGDVDKSQEDREQERQKQAQDSPLLVRKLDLMHEAAQKPVKVLLRPLDKAMANVEGYGKQPLLRTWDLMHELVKRPLQVVTTPLEHAVLGHKGAMRAHHTWDDTKQHPTKVFGFSSAKYAPVYKEEPRNAIVESIKDLEWKAARPLSDLTSPIRRLILSKDASVKNAAANKQNEHGDKILSLIERLNNVALRPLELATNPISRLIAPNLGPRAAKREVPERKSSQGSDQSAGQQRDNDELGFIDSIKQHMRELQQQHKQQQLQQRDANIDNLGFVDSIKHHLRELQRQDRQQLQQLQQQQQQPQQQKQEAKEDNLGFVDSIEKHMHELQNQQKQKLQQVQQIQQQKLQQHQQQQQHHQQAHQEVQLRHAQQHEQRQQQQQQPQQPQQQDKMESRTGTTGTTKQQGHENADQSKVQATVIEDSVKKSVQPQQGHQQSQAGHGSNASDGAATAAGPKGGQNGGSSEQHKTQESHASQNQTQHQPQQHQPQQPQQQHQQSQHQPQQQQSQQHHQQQPQQ